MSISPLLSSLQRQREINHWPVEITGTTNASFYAWLLAQDNVSPSPRLAVLPTDKAARRFADDLTAFSPSLEVVILEAFDESPYSGLYPSNDIFKSRCHFLWKAMEPKPHQVFVGSVESLLQKTLPIDIFKSYQVVFSKGEELDLDLVMAHLSECGYSASPLVEDVGTFSRRGDILDIFSPTSDKPFRIELFGDQIESIRFFDVETQLSSEKVERAVVVPAREIILNEKSLQTALSGIKKFCDENEIKKDEREELLSPLKQKILSHGIDFWFPFFYDKTASPLSSFGKKPICYLVDTLEITRVADDFNISMKEKFRSQIENGTPVPPPERIYSSLDEFFELARPYIVEIKNIDVGETIQVKAFNTSDFSTVVRAAREAKKDFFNPAAEKLMAWRTDGLKCFIFAGTQVQAQRIQYLLNTHQVLSEITQPQEENWTELFKKQEAAPRMVHILPKSVNEGGRFESEGFVFLKEEDLFGTKVQKQHYKTKGTLEQRTNKLAFGNLNPGDFIVHTLHGIGIYEGLKKMAVQNTEAEYIQLKYKDNDKLYLPVYRISQIQKYSSPSGYAQVDKLGSTSWQKAKVKVRNDLKEIAAELLSLYAKRKGASGFAFSPPDDEFKEFEATFPYDETPDQLKAIDDVVTDMQQPRPMDRLVCGDVGFGKTEVAIRAAYKAVQDHKQVALLVPTTVLAFQHFQTFTKRFKDEPVQIAMASRFSSPADVKKNLTLAKEGKLDILIGTHRLLSKDVEFKDLGLLIIDEEQKFGVTHKEKIKKFKTQVDVLTLSATPIPRTLNMGLMGIRDLSLINTPPEDRLSIRTFISRFDEETIRKSIMGEIKRGGQVYFIHNRVQSIYDFTNQIKEIVPDARIKIGHGQMADEDLEKTMLEFYNHEFDVLICTTIIESGLDIPRANTIIIDRADTFGLSQLYQLRGRVGRSKDRAYAYLLIPPQGVVDKIAAERLKVIQDHTELGSGFQIAHHDLELRGSGNILGDDQSGHIAAVGYELYMELLDQTLHEIKGEAVADELEPEINLRIPAFIPDTYIEDIRIRLSYYKMLTEIQNEIDLDKLEAELVDRFGELPEQVTNLFGIMLIRKVCKDLGIKDITSGPKNLSLVFGNTTKVKVDQLVRLATQDGKKYQITPDNKLNIRFTSDKWAPILEELRHLSRTLF